MNVVGMPMAYEWPISDLSNQKQEGKASVQMYYGCTMFMMKINNRVLLIGDAEALDFINKP